jgi:hypothetical protein
MNAPERMIVMADARSTRMRMAIDETIERRRGEWLSAKGTYRDPACSSYTHFGKTIGWRWEGL